MGLSIVLLAAGQGKRMKTAKPKPLVELADKPLIQYSLDTAMKLNPERIILADHLPNDEHLKRIKLADLFLDTFPYNAHTTASDAVRMGLPVLTYLGESFGSRVSGSVLKALNMDELVAKSKKEYVNIAVELATNKNKLKKIID